MKPLVYGVLCSQFLGILTAELTCSADSAVFLDDFVDAVRIDLPEQEDEFLANDDVGPYLAERYAIVSGGRSDPSGFLDINMFHPSQATITIDAVNPTSTTLRPSVVPQFVYMLPNPTDLTNSGAYDGFFVDFDLNRGPVPAQRLRMVVNQDVNGRRTFWEQTFSLVDERLEPFSAVFPFAKFFSRGGGPYAPPFSAVPEIQVHIISRGDENAQWEIRLDSIRIGALPEGDYNANGAVEQEDLDLVLLNWGAPALVTPPGWFHDLPDETIGQAHLDAVLLNWGNRIQPPSAGIGAAAIPEPAAATLLLIAAAPPLAGRLRLRTEKVRKGCQMGSSELFLSA